MTRYNGYSLPPLKYKEITVDAKNIFMAIAEIRDRENLREDLSFTIITSDYASINAPNGTKVYLILKEEL